MKNESDAWGIAWNKFVKLMDDAIKGLDELYSWKPVSAKTLMSIYYHKN